MTYTPTELEAFVRHRAPEIAKEIRDAACKACNEADLVAAVERSIEKFAKNFDVTLNLSRERTLINGRADAVYNRFVIEYEPPNSLRKNIGARTNQHAIDQVKQYMDGLERVDRHKKERLAGAVLDGSFFIFVRFRDGHWHIDDPVPVEAHSTETFLRYLLSLSTELAVTPENLVRDFGENSNTARAVVPALYRVLTTTDSPKVQTLFQQWRRQFQEVTGYDASGGQLDALTLAKSYAVKDTQPDIEKLFFAIHSYYATFIKLLALQVAHYYLMPKIGTGLAAAANYDTNKLAGYLSKMERGGLLADLGIRNFLEGDFFGWYLDVWNDAAAGPGLDTALRRLIGDLANYSLVTLDVDPEETRDLLKRLYQNLMPKKLRHALGEYYTPDWLAERLLNQLGYDGNPKWRLLDPACGSGTFLVLAIKRIRQYADDKLLPPGQVLNMILQNIVGYDLNPLAVMSARTNYLLALGDLLEQRTGEITIPVYLADSILTPSEGTDLLSQHRFTFNTAVGRFSVPRSLVQARYIDQLADLLEECVTTCLTTDQFSARFLHTFPLDPEADSAEVEIALALYEQLLDLERRDIDGIWARIIKNAFAPLFQGRFDFVAGNPPWVNWASLPQEYRTTTLRLWQRYALFLHKGLEARLGGANDDISVLMTYVAADRYLKPRGRLGFVITQSLFKSVGGGEGFRQFRLDDTTPLMVIHVDDMVDLQPFESASNRTSIIALQRNLLTRYPVPYTVWRKAQTGSIGEDLTLNEVIAATHRYRHVAVPMDPSDLRSPWFTGREKAVAGANKAIGSSKYQARKGLETSMAAIYRLDLVASRPDGLLVVANQSEASKSEVEGVQAAIEADFVHPYLRGRDVWKWGWAVNGYVVVPQQFEQPSKGYPERDLAISFPKTYAYLDHFRRQLSERAVYRKLLAPGGEPFYAMYNVGEYTFSPHKVLWRYIASRLTCTVVSTYSDPTLGPRKIVPDSKLVLVPFESGEEAHFVCAALNNCISEYLVASYTVATQISTHVLEYVAVPRYDPSNTVHVMLADLSQQAHAATEAGDAARVREIEAEINRQAAKLWGLTDAELQEIQESLAELA